MWNVQSKMNWHLTVIAVHSDTHFITNQVCFYNDWMFRAIKAIIRRSSYENIEEGRNNTESGFSLTYFVMLMKAYRSGTWPEVV